MGHIRYIHFWYACTMNLLFPFPFDSHIKYLDNRVLETVNEIIKMGACKCR